jgi:hypothetical protein
MPAPTTTAREARLTHESDFDMTTWIYREAKLKYIVHGE